MNTIHEMDLDLNRLASVVNRLPYGLDRRRDAVETMMEAAAAKIVRRTMTSHDYLTARFDVDEEIIDAHQYAEETDVEDLICSTRSTAAVTISWVCGVGPAVTQTVTHGDHTTVTRDYTIIIDTESDLYDGRRVLDAAAAIKAHDGLSAACLAFTLENYTDVDDAFIPALGRSVKSTTTLAVSLTCDHRRGSVDATPYATTTDATVPAETIAHLASVVPDSDGSGDGVTDVIRVYDKGCPGVEGFDVPSEVYVRTLTSVYPTVAALTGSSVLVDYLDYHVDVRPIEEYDVDDLDDDPEPEIYGFDPDDDERPLHSAAAAYADFVGARPY